MKNSRLKCNLEAGSPEANKASGPQFFGTKPKGDRRPEEQ